MAASEDWVMEEARYENLLATSIEITWVGALLETTRRRIHQSIGWKMEPHIPKWDRKRVDSRKYILVEIFNSRNLFVHLLSKVKLQGSVS